MSKQGDKHCRVVLVPCPLQGHINPMLQLAAILHSNGFSITIVHTKFNSPKPLNYPDFQFLFIEDGLLDHEISSPDKTALVLILNANCEAPFQDCMSNLMQEQEMKDEIVCIIYDELAYFSETAAYNLKLPSIIFRTTHAINFLVRSTASYQLRLQGKIPLPDRTAQEPIPEYPFLRVKDLSISNFGPLPDFFKLITNARNIRNSKAIIYNTMNCLEESPLAELRQQQHVPIFAIGPIHKIVPPSLSNNSSLQEEDNSCISWLDKQKTKSVIYISMGSIATIKQEEIAEMAWGLADSKKPFLWVIRPGLIFGLDWIDQILPKGFKESVGNRGCIVKWVPQKEVLRHKAVGGFWSHCGWNSLLESICEGVPLICRPSFGDQKVTARLVSQVWKVGLQLDNELLERGEVESVVRRLMGDIEGEEMRQRAMDLKKKVELEIREGGSSYNGLKELVKFIRLF